jgi:hypothetical protein
VYDGLAAQNRLRNDPDECLAGQADGPQAMENGMKIELENPTLTLARDGLIALRDAQGTRVACLTGALWITEDQGRYDIILEAGESVTLRRRGLTLVMALQPASLQLSERRVAPVQRLATRLSRWLPATARQALG